MTTTRAQILAEAASLIGSDRNSSYGEPGVNLGRTAALWSAYLERPVTARDVAWLMVLLKIAREIHGHSPDSAIDAAGYAAIAGELA